ncbi:uncharacterized protein EI97DRAFT_387014 [Westerdykella ornata]|uniref:Mitochondrial phosphate carrier protein n=1 Tax=Westerdykella ornata TaxID=318751 RepID=A0A6A6J5M4_WESOR|nr:uncharacterized protein EI97DRAFT_387014 [Westerdykella ornata]KAF2271890.1 hypothetical protein EI97DRAFT_387014 [Westerdykella ornata]
MIITRGVSLTNFLVASSALGFQVFVLYPWHLRLDDDFEALKKEHFRVLRTVEGALQGTRSDEQWKSIREQLGELREKKSI